MSVGSLTTALHHPAGALALASALVVAALATWAVRVQGQPLDLEGVPAGASFVYPPHGFPGRAAHALHAAQIPCATCHGEVADSTSAAQDHLPTMEVCATCHAEARDTVDPEACAFCHPGYRPVWSGGEAWMAARDPRFPAVGPEPVRPFRPNLIFSHAAHADSACADCHGSVDVSAGPTAADADGAELPGEPLCRDCHVRPAGAEVHGGGLRCATCHPGGGDGDLETAAAADRLAGPQRLRPLDHEVGWAQAHGAAAQLDPAACASCHAERDCLACHAPGETGAALVDAPHPPGFREQHAAAARRETTACAACHAVERFCVDCHRDARVGDESTRAGDRFHGAGWVELAGGEHAFAARRNLSECVSCHQEETCVTCHASFDPHGATFLSRCAELLDAAPQMCARCHDAGELSRLGALCR